MKGDIGILPTPLTLVYHFNGPVFWIGLQTSNTTYLATCMNYNTKLIQIHRWVWHKIVNKLAIEVHFIYLKA
jgi:hypothetical protein